MKRADRLRAIEDRIRRGDLDGAIAEYRKILETTPDDWPSVIALGDLQVQQGKADEGAAHLSRAADHFLEEGFYAKAAALYRRISKLVEDDHALLSLIDIAARQGLLAEARQHLVLLERQRRDRGDGAGADECLASLDAIVEVQHDSEAPGPDGGAEVRPPAPQAIAIPDDLLELPDEAVTVIDAEALPDDDPVLPAPEPPPQETLPPPETNVATEPAPVRSGRTRRGTQRPKRTRVTGGTRSLQDVFDGLRSAARRDDAADQAQRRFDEAQAQLRDGNEDAAIPELEAAAGAPMLRFVACAQLGRLHVARGELAKGIEWLERATQTPPVSPDEGHAVRYELGDALDRDGERTRALVVFMELDAQRARYRDVRTRIEALSRAFDGEGGEA